MDTVGATVAAALPADDESILIELDLTTDWTPTDAAAAMPRPGWWLAIVLGPLLILALVAGGARARTLDQVFELAIDTQQRDLVGNVLYLTTRAGDEMRAYDIVHGRTLFTRPITGNNLDWARYGDTIAITTTDATTKAVAVEVLDGRTGRTLWHRSSAAVIGGSPSVIVIRRFASGTNSGGQPGELLGVRTAAAAVVWNRTLPASAATFPLWSSGADRADDTGRILVVDAPGAVRAIDAATGNVLATPSTSEWQLGSSSRRAERPAIPCLVYLSGIQAGANDSRAVCLPDGIRGIVAGGAGIAPPLVTGRAGGRSVTVDTDGTVRLTDTTTGSLVRTFHGWAGAGVINGGTGLIVAQTRSPRGDRPMLAAVDTTSGRLRVLAAIPTGMLAPSCRHDGRYLLCYGGSKLGVWRLKPSTLR